MHAHPSSMYAPRRNPLLGTGLGVLFGLGAAAAGAWGVKTLLERNSKTNALGPSTGPRGVPAQWLAQVHAVLADGATVKDAGLMAGAPFALNVLGITGVEGPTTAQFPYVTQPEAFWIRSKQNVSVPMLSLYTSDNGEMGLQMDLDQMGGKGIAIDDEQVIYADGTYAGAIEQTDHLVLNISQALAQSAYDTATKRIKQHGDVYDVPSGTRDAYVRQVLAQWVPGFDWSAAPDNLGGKLGEWASSVAMLWQGVSLVGQIAYQNHWNNQH